MDQRFSVPDFVSPADAAAYQAAQWNNFASTAAGPSQPHVQTRRTRSPSFSRSPSPDRRNTFADDVPPDYDFADDTPPEEVPEENYYDEARGRSAFKRKGKKGPQRHATFQSSPNPPSPHPFPFAPPPGAGLHGHHPPPPPPPAGQPGTPPPPPPPSSGHHGPHPHPHGRHGGRGGWAGAWAGPNSNGMPWAWYGGPHARGGGHHGGRGGRGRRGGFGHHAHGSHDLPNTFWQGPWADIIDAASRTAAPNNSFPGMEELGKMFAENFGFAPAGEKKEKDRGMTANHDDDDADDVDFEPPVDVFNTPGAYLVHVSLPGARKEDISLTWDEKNGELKVQGVITRKVDDQVMEGLEVGERHVGLFRRIVRLGDEGKDSVDGDAIDAKMEEGVLAIKVGKTIKADYVKVKKVDIQ